MKQYVLDDAVVPGPVGAAPEGVAAGAFAVRPPIRWRWVLLVLVLEPVALAALYLGLNGTPGESRAAPASGGVAYVASFSFPRSTEPALAAAPVAAAPLTSIREERGRYVVELRDAPPGPALSQLAQATKARVTGADIFAGSPLRLTSSLVTASPREAWQAVFGGVANFAIACAGSACEVRFISLAAPGTPGPAPFLVTAPGLVQGVPQTAPAMAPAVQAVAEFGAAAMQGGDAASTEN